MSAAGAGSAAPGRPLGRAARRVVGRAALLPLVLLASGCASVFGSHATGPGGIAAYDHDLRTLLRQGRYDSALVRVGPERSKAGDELLRLQNEVLVAHRAGDLEASADALERAVVLAEDRYTRSVSRAILSAFTNDRVLPYRPPPTERLLLHYYGALVHLRRGGPSAAAVEARRLEQRLVAAEDERMPSGARRQLHVALHRFAGTIFEAAGEANAAGVAHRRADRLEGTNPDTRGGQIPDVAAGEGGGSASGASAGALPESGDSPDGASPAAREVAAHGEGAAANDGTAYGEVLLAVEQGFVAHRVERSITVPVWPEEMKRLSGASDSAKEAVRYETALRVARRSLAAGQEAASFEDEEEATPRVPAAVNPTDCGIRVIPGVGRVKTPCGDGRIPARGARRNLEGTPEIVRVAWPEYRAGAPPPTVRVRTPGDGISEARWSADLSAAAVEEFGDRAPEILAKALLRAVVKNVVSEEVEDEVEDEDETLGEVTGVALDVLGALTERADTRSWTLLPARLQLIRLRLPAGEHRLELFSGGEGGATKRPTETVEVRVPAGGVTVASVALGR